MEYVSVQDAEVPALGLGTWQVTGRACYEAVSTALDVGYRHVDTAQLYGNESEVGRAIADAAVDRDDVFVTTKLTPGNARYDDVLATTRESLDRLGTGYVDLLLLHWPNPLVNFADTARAMAELHDDGVVRHAGVSNFRRWRLRRAREKSPIPLLADQVRLHPFYTQQALRAYSQAVDTMVTAYSPLAHGGILEEDLLAGIGVRYHKSVPQVALRWVTQLENVTAVARSTSRDHLADNHDIFDFRLSEDEMAAIERPSLARAAALFFRNELAP